MTADDHFRYEYLPDRKCRAIRNEGHTGSILNCTHQACQSIRRLSERERQMPDRHVNHQLPPSLPPEDPTLTAAAQKFVIKELTAKIQLLVDWLDTQGLLEDHAYTFPDGDIWKAQDLPVKNPEL